MIKKKIIFSSFVRKFRMEQLQSHIWRKASSYLGKHLRISSYTVLGSPSSYMTVQRLHSEFPYIWGKFDFSFLSVCRYSYKLVSGLLTCAALKWFSNFVLFLLVYRSIHAKCQILAWNLVLVGCPLKTLHRYKYINRTISKKPGNKTTPIVRD